MATSKRTASVVSSDMTLTESNHEMAVIDPPKQELVLNSKQVNFLQTLIDSKQLPAHIRTVADAFTVSKMGKELGFPIMQALHFIIPIQGKLSLSAKAIGAILRKGKITMQTKEDALWVYRDGSVAEYRKTGDEKPIDRRTSILFTRDGIEELVSFTWMDATTQGLTEKSNWTRMPREMLYARCLSKGANRIAQDLLLGLYSTDELYDVFGTPSMKVKRDEDGCITEITPHEPVS